MNNQNYPTQGRSKSSSLNTLVILWLITMYFPDPIPFIDEIGIPVILMTSSEGRKRFILAILLIGALMLIGIPPVGSFV